MTRRDRSGALGSAVAVFALSACGGDSSFIEFQPAADIDWLAAVAVSGEGTTAVATALVPSGEALELVAERSDDTFVLGYAGHDIPSDRIAEDRIPSEALNVTAGCDPHLPPPIFAGRASEQSIDALDPSATDLPRLGASWLDELCAADRALLLAPDCGIPTCHPELTRDGCSVAIESNDCDLGTVSLVLDGLAGGPACLETPVCVAEASAPGAVASFTCPLQTTRDQPCRVHLYEAPEAPFFETETIAVFENVSPLLPDPTRRTSFRAGRDGYIRDFAVTADRLYVVTPSRASVVSHDCESNEPMALQIYDLEGLERVATASAPPCLFGLNPLPDGSLIAGYGSHADIRLVHLDADGRVLASGVVTDIDGDSILGELSLSANYETGIVIINTRSQQGGFSTLAFRVSDLSSAAPLHPRMGFYASGGSALEGQQFAVSDAEADALHFFDLESGESFRSGVPHLSSIEPTVPYFSRAARRIFLPITQLAPRLAIADTDGPFDAHSPTAFETPGAPMSLTEIGTSTQGDPDRLIVGFVEDTQLDLLATVAPFDPTGERYLPGAQVIGYGAIPKMITDPQGRAYAVLPWSGQIVRISLAR